MTPQELFVTTLRRHRQRNRVSLEEISIDTRVRIELFEGLERNDLSRWPRGVFARAWIRAYATAIGLDPSDTVDEICRLFTHADRRAQSTFEDIAALIGHHSRLGNDVPPHLERRADARMVYELRRPAWRTAMARSTRAVLTWLSKLLFPPWRGRRAPRVSS